MMFQLMRHLSIDELVIMVKSNPMDGPCQIFEGGGETSFRHVVTNRFRPAITETFLTWSSVTSATLFSLSLTLLQLGKAKSSNH